MQSLPSNTKVDKMDQRYTPSEGSAIENEHSKQIQMINLLTQAVIENKAQAEKEAILDQLIDFSQVHFSSEKMIMREYSYDRYEEHDKDHEALIERLNKLKSQVHSNSNGLDLQTLNSLRNMLLRHISSQDLRFATFLSGVSD